jgi:uncharacterized membrane protein
LATTGLARAQAVFHAIYPDGYSTRFFAVNRNGTVAAGDTFYLGQIVPTASFFEGPPSIIADAGRATALSDDGNTIAGWGGADSAFVWRPETGPLRLGPAQGYTLFASQLSALSADGRIGCGGYSATLNGRRSLLLWSASNGQRLVEPLAEWSGAAGFGMSADGQTVVGTGSIPGGDSAGFRWSDLGSFRVLPLPAGLTASGASGASADAHVVVGFAGTISSRRACRWIGDSPALLPPLTESDNIGATSVSRDGWTVAILELGPPGTVVGLWDPLHGTRDIKDVIRGAGGPDLEGWELNGGVVSGDGRSVVGWAIDPQGLQPAWIAHLPAFCYANCDDSSTTPVLNVLDFNCFLNRFASGDEVYANCDQSETPPVLNVLDFNCFLNAFSAGCP